MKVNEEGLVTIPGVVRNGRFLPLEPQPTLAVMPQLTSIAMQEARSPESGGLDPAPYESTAILVCGHDGAALKAWHDEP